MTQTQQAQLPEMLRNWMMSSQMEGFEVTEAMESMYLDILNGKTTLDECLEQLHHIRTNQLNAIADDIIQENLQAFQELSQ